MDLIQVHPSGFIDPVAPQANSKFLAPEALRGSGGLLLDSKGERFANELGSRSYLANSILEHCAPHESPLDSGRAQPMAYMLLNRQVSGVTILSS
jgi:aspartate oxidase